MEHQLQHDPRTKQNIKEALYSFLYEPTQRQFMTRRDTLIIRNTILGGYSHKSLMYKGTLHNCDNSPPPRKMNRIVPQLIPAMDDYLAELKELNDKEVPHVLGFINQVLNSSNALQDYLRLLPAAVHRPVEQFISVCPCKGKNLTEKDVTDFHRKNTHPIDLMKQRMVKNLLI